MGAAALASPWAHRKGHRKMCWGMRAGLMSHLWVASATGDGEWALSCLPRAVPHAAELNDSCWASGRVSGALRKAGTPYF